MLVSVFLALFLPCAGMSAVFVVYICLLWYAASNSQAQGEFRTPEKRTAAKGLTAAELERLPKVTGKELARGTECVVCLDVVEPEDPARQVPGCNHGFHLQCVDTWLSQNSVCPICRAKLEPQMLNPDDNPC
ncbi:hypothetical protein NMG60_11016079 [Bertholletia excelsa]